MYERQVRLYQGENTRVQQDSDTRVSEGMVAHSPPARVCGCALTVRSIGF